MVPTGDCTTPAPIIVGTSISHHRDVVEHDGFLVSREQLGRDRYVTLYRGELGNCERVTTLKQGKSGLKNPTTGKRFASVERAVAYYREGGK